MASRFGRVQGPAAVGAVLVVLLAGCAGRTSGGHDAARTARAQAEAARSGSRRELAALIGCLRRAGADAEDVSAHPDLQVPAEAAVSFSTFDAYVGIGVRPREAAAAARRLAVELRLLQQAGRPAVRGDALYYFDAPLVPPAAARLVTACLDDSPDAATAAMASLADELPRIELPPTLETGFAKRCRDVAGRAACACAYVHATRLFDFGQVAGIAGRWRRARATQVLAGLVRTCAPALPD